MPRLSSFRAAPAAIALALAASCVSPPDAPHEQVRSAQPSVRPATLGSQGGLLPGGGDGFSPTGGSTQSPVTSRPASPVASGSAPGFHPQIQRGLVWTLAGSTAGYADGVGPAGLLKQPRGIAVAADRTIYVADYGNNVIRKLTLDGRLLTFAGSGQAGFADGAGDRARFNNPRGLVLSKSGLLYVADYANNRVRVVSTDGVVGTFVGSGTGGTTVGSLASAEVWYPAGLAFYRPAPPASPSVPPSSVPSPSPSVSPTPTPDELLVADSHNHRILRTTHDSQGAFAGLVRLAGSGLAGAGNATGGAASFAFPTGVAANARGEVFIADTSNNLIRKVSTPDAQGNLTVSTFAGSGLAGQVDGKGSAAQFSSPNGLACDALGNVYVADTLNHCIRKISPDGSVTTLAGSGLAGDSDGPFAQAKFDEPYALALDAEGNVYVADSANNRIRVIQVAEPHPLPSPS